jgi:ribosomal-protein-alanine N-acetyltransferase
MTEHELLEVVDLEESCGLSHWGWDAYHAELQSEHRQLMLVARIAASETDAFGTIAGYIVARLTAGELHVNNLAVRETARRCGVGTSLLNRVIETAQVAGAFAAFLEVRAGNAAAQAFYEKNGFFIAGRRRDYYSAPIEDALIMSAQLALTA